jgi:hypothetical protein
MRCVAYLAVFAGDDFRVAHEKNGARGWRADVFRRRDGKDEDDFIQKR